MQSSIYLNSADFPSLFGLVLDSGSCLIRLHFRVGKPIGGRGHACLPEYTHPRHSAWQQEKGQEQQKTTPFGYSAKEVTKRYALGIENAFCSYHSRDIRASYQVLHSIGRGGGVIRSGLEHGGHHITTEGRTNDLGRGFHACKKLFT
jgi:hypothetical protein